tara:strand:- start:1098 stop:1706 length:609 start_codon:yes stop_codon:yes gene_type:complete
MVFTHFIGLATAIINNTYEKQEEKNIWDDCKWGNICKLGIDAIGKTGEAIINAFCKKAGIENKIDGMETKIWGDKWDGTIKEKTVEIKTARQDMNESFQHEFNTTPWEADYIIFLDISPKKMYITMFKNWSQEHWEKSGRDSKIKCGPCFPTRSVTWRDNCTGNFKFTTTVKINEVCPNTFIFDETQTDYSEFKEFVDKIIP